MSAAVFQDGESWYFWDETWTMFLGPFTTEDEARQAVEAYGQWLTTGVVDKAIKVSHLVWSDGETLTENK